MYKIGDFAKFSQVSIHMLRHYDKIGLLQPHMLDESTGYRYYSVEQLPRLNRILVLKELGFRLEQIGDLLEADLSIDEIRGMLKLSESQIEREIETEQARLERVRARLKHIELEGNPPPYDILIKSVDRQRALSTGHITRPDEVLVGIARAMSAEIAERGWMTRNELQVVIHGPPTEALHHNVELGFAVTSEAPRSLVIASGDQLKLTEFPAIDAVATTIHDGPRSDIELGWAALCRWIEAQRYLVCGLFREIYLRPGKTYLDSENLVELQIPICK